MEKRKANNRKRRKKSKGMPAFLISAGVLLIISSVLIIIPNLNGDAEPVGGNETLENGMSSVVPQEVNFPAPELTLMDLDGNTVALDDYLGKVVLLNNWATWCPPCKAEMPELESFYRAHKDDGFVIIAVEAGDAEAGIRAFVDSAGLTFPIWMDPKNQSLAAFRNQGLPNSYVIDETGTVRLAWTGAISESMLEKHVTPLLND